MKHPQRPRRPLSVVLALAIAVVAPQCAREGCVSPTPEPTPPVIDLALVQSANNRDFAVAATEMVEAAEQRVHLVEYVIYDSGPVHDLLQALVDAQARGVDVAVLADEEAGNTVHALDWLEAHDVRTRIDSPETTTHNKLIIADDVVLLGSHNLSSNALESNNEASIQVAIPEVTAWYEALFSAMWEDSDVDPDLGTPDTDPIVPIKNREIAPRLEACITGAQERIRLVLYAMTYRDDYPDSDANRLVEELVAAHQQGIDVAIVLDQSDWMVDNEINDRAIELLVEGGVPLRFPPADEVTHAKMLSCDDTVIVSDANWAYSAFSLYNGTSIQVTGEAIRLEYDAWFDSIWAGATAAEL
jgi:phosphatidylserine/phosphatidylglycerophosphate/cardiolipin synthase-like enzyme